MKNIFVIVSFIMIYSTAFLYAEEKASFKTDSENQSAKDRLIGHWNLYSKRGRTTGESLQLIFRNDGTGTVIETKRNKEEKENISWTVRENIEKEITLFIESKDSNKKEEGLIKFEGECLIIDDSCFKKVNAVSDSEKEKRRAELMEKMIGDWYMESENGRPLKEKPQFTLRKNGTGTGVLKSRGKEEKKEYNWTVIEQTDGGWRFSIIEKESGRNHGGMISFEGDCLMVDKYCLKKIEPSSNNDAEKKKNELINKIVGTWAAASENGKPIPDSLQFSFRKDGTGTAVGDIDGKTEQKEFNWTVSEKEPDQWVMAVAEQGKEKNEEGPIRFEGECLMIETICLKKTDSVSAAETEKMKEEISQKVIGDWDLETENGKAVPYGEKAIVYFYRDGKGKTVTETADRRMKTEEFIWKIFLKDKDQWMISFKEQSGRRNRIETKEISFKNDRFYIGSLGLKKRETSSLNPVIPVKTLDGILSHLKAKWNRQSE